VVVTTCRARATELAVTVLAVMVVVTNRVMVDTVGISKVDMVVTEAMEVGMIVDMDSRTVMVDMTAVRLVGGVLVGVVPEVGAETFRDLFLLLIYFVIHYFQFLRFLDEYIVQNNLSLSLDYSLLMHTFRTDFIF
jgi:hypothetical protein